MKRWLFSLALCLVCILCAFQPMSVGAADELAAFPGAEGGGKYTRGARASENIEVYHITSLADSGEGTLRDAVTTGDESIGRIIVFDVGGIINIESELKIVRGNLTILGQTAPGDGITIAGEGFTFSGAASAAEGGGYKARVINDLIIRYLRIRPTDRLNGEPDGLGGRWNNNVIIDHCSVSWAVDEGLTLYGGTVDVRETRELMTQGKNLTMQYCIGAESLRMSSHFKGAHGYGAIWGGVNASYHHNLLAHNDSRNPRMDRNLQGTDVRNNVFYNWGVSDSAYGAENFSSRNKFPITTNMNWVNNYHSYGPTTRKDINARLFKASSDGAKANYYMEGNTVVGSSKSNKDNVTNNSSVNFLSSPITSLPYYYVDYADFAANNNAAQAVKQDGTIDILQPTETETAENALDTVVQNAGATLPKRDAIDAKLVEDAKNRTGRVVNMVHEVGGFNGFEETQRTFVIPEEWKTANGMGTSAETDIVQSGEFAGYTWIEAYVNDWTAEQSLPTNPKITVTSPAIASINSNVNGMAVDNGNWAVIKDNETVNYKASAVPQGSTTVTKMELYDGEDLIKTYDGAEIDDQISLGVGTHHLTCLAYNDIGETTRSVTSIVYANHANSGDWTVTEIGSSTNFKGKGGGGVTSDGMLTIGGSGALRAKTGFISSGSSGTGVKSDVCTFVNKPVTGDFEFVVKVNDIPKNENGALAGIMFRETLDANAKMVFIGDGWVKFGENIQPVYRTATGGTSTSTYMPNSSGGYIENASESLYTTQMYPMPQYMKIQRVGTKITISVSDSGVNWTDNARQPVSYTLSGLQDTGYVGFAVDSLQGVTADASTKPYYSMASFSDIKLTYDEDITPSNPYAIPFYDEEYTVPPWTFSLPQITDKDMSAGKYPASGDQVKDSGHVLVVNMEGGNAKRKFDTVSGGVATFSFDYLTKGKNGQDVCKIIFYEGDPNSSDSVCEIHVNEGGGFSAVDSTGQNINIGTDNINQIVKDTWYNLTLQFDNDARLSGDASWINMSAKKYTHYKNAEFSETETFNDVPVPAMKQAQLGGVQFYSLAGCAKYVGDFKLELSGRGFASKPTITDGKITAEINNPTEDGEEVTYIIGSYNSEGMIIDSKFIKVPCSDDVQTFTEDINTEIGGSVTVYLWKDNYEPITEKIQL